MLAFVAMLLFILSPFIPDVGPWPMITLGLALLAAHMVWAIGVPWIRRAP